MSEFPPFLRLNNVPFNVYTTFCICWWTLELLLPFGYYKAAVNMRIQVISQRSCFWFFLLYIQSDIVASYDNSIFNFLRNCLFSIEAALLYILTCKVQGLRFPHALDICFLFLFCFDKVIKTVVRCYLNVGFIYLFFYFIYCRTAGLETFCFLAPGTGFMEDSFPQTGSRGRGRWFQDDSSALHSSSPPAVWPGSK